MERLIQKPIIYFWERWKRHSENKRWADRSVFLHRIIKEFGIQEGKERFKLYYPDISPDDLLIQFPS